MQMRLKDGKTKVLTFSYDDGNYEDLRLIEIFNKYNLKGTFNVNTGLFKDNGFNRTEPHGKVTADEAVKIYQGHEVAVHTLTHPWAATLKPNELIREVCEDRKNIERMFKTVARGMAYPFGCYNADTLDILKQCGIAYSRTAISTHGFGFPDNWLELHPTCHHDDEKLFELAENFAQSSGRWGTCEMFYVWGHSYEFPRNNNWDRIEKLAEYLGNREDIWYATNIEIYDYVEAYNRLHVSFDNSLVYNPSAIKVWFCENGKTYCAEPGMTIGID